MYLFDLVRRSSKSVRRHLTRMDAPLKFLAPAAASAATGVILSLAAIFVLTTAAENNVRPEMTPGQPQSSLLNQVQYGSR